MRKISSRRAGFTIVELLVVIVVIGVLAAIALVSYTGISQKAVASSLQSDLTSASQQLKMFYTDNGTYPTSMAMVSGSFCPTPADARYCLKSSPGNTYSYSSSSPWTAFTLTATNGSLVYRIADTYPPGQVTPLTAISATSGTVQSGSLLTAGSLSPSGAMASYQWQSAATSNGTYTAISGATSSTYMPVSGDAGRYLKVIATGTNTYGGSVTSAAVGPVTVPPPIFASGGTVTSNGSVRTHTFSPGTYTITAGVSGTVTISITGGGGGGGDWRSDGGDGSPSYVVYSSTTYEAYGGGGGGEGNQGDNGSDGATNSPSGWTSTTGGAANAGYGYDEGDGNWTGDGGSGGKLYKATFAVAIGQSMSVVVGGGGGGSGVGSPGGAGVVIISYPY